MKQLAVIKLYNFIKIMTKKKLNNFLREREKNYSKKIQIPILQFFFIKFSSKNYLYRNKLHVARNVKESFEKYGLKIASMY